MGSWHCIPEGGVVNILLVVLLFGSGAATSAGGIRFETEPEPFLNIVSRDDIVILKCLAVDVSSGQRLLNVTWLHNDSIVPYKDFYSDAASSFADGETTMPSIGHQRSRRFTSDEDTTSLRLTVHSWEQQGFYQCAVSNANGTLLSRRSKIQLARLHGVTIDPVLFVAHADGVARFECRVQDALPSALVYNWTLNGLPLPNEERFVALPTSGILHVLRVAATDSNMTFRCTVHASRLLAQSPVATLVVEGVASTSLATAGTVVEKYRVYSPTYVKLTWSLHAPLMLECLTTSLVGTYARVAWKVRYYGRDAAQEITAPHRVVGSSLLLLRVGVRDAGSYLCVADDVVVATIDLSVDSLLDTTLTVEQPPQSETVVKRRGETARFTCNVTSLVPSTHIRWFFNGKLLEPSLNVRMIPPVDDVPALHLSADNSSTLYTRLLVSSVNTSGFYQCFAGNEHGEVTTATQLVVEDVSNTPWNLVARASPTCCSVQLSWNVAPEVLEENALQAFIFGYRQSTGPISTYNTEAVDDGRHACNRSGFCSADCCSLMRLNPHTNYTFHLSALVRSTITKESAEVEVQTADGRPVCAPKVRVVGLRTPGAVRVGWTAPMDECLRGSVQGYVVQYRAKEASAPMEVEVPPLLAEFIIANLTLGTTHYFRVLPVTFAGRPIDAHINRESTTSKFPWFAHFVDFLAIFDDIPPPSNVTAVALNSSAVRVGWSVPLIADEERFYNFSRSFLRFAVVFRRTTSEWKSVVVAPSDEVHATVVLDGLRSNSTYEMNVRAIGRDLSAGKPSNTIVVRTLPRPQNIPPRVSEIACMEENATSVKVVWRYSAVTGGVFRVRFAEVDDEQRVWSDVSRFHENITQKWEFTASGLEPGRKYAFLVEPLGSLATPTLRTVCHTREAKSSKPLNVVVTELSPDAVNVSWTPPLRPNGVILDYLVYMEKQLVAVTPGNETSVVVGLRSKTDGVFFVVAQNGAGLSEESEAIVHTSGTDSSLMPPPLPSSPAPEVQTTIEYSYKEGILIGFAIVLVAFFLCVVGILLLRSKRTAYDDRLFALLARTRTPSSDVSNSLSSTKQFSGSVVEPIHDVGTAPTSVVEMQVLLPLLAQNTRLDAKGGDWCHSSASSIRRSGATVRPSRLALDVDVGEPLTRVDGTFVVRECSPPSPMDSMRSDAAMHADDGRSSAQSDFLSRSNTNDSGLGFYGSQLLADSLDCVHCERPQSATTRSLPDAADGSA